MFNLPVYRYILYICTVKHEKRGDPTVPLFAYMDVESYIEECLGSLFEQPEYSSIFLLEVRGKGSKYTVYLDSDSGLSFADLQKISRYLEEKLETDRVVPENYTLDVSSPGADRPLTLPRQYSKHIGRDLLVKLNDETQKKGTLEAVEEESIVIGTKKKKETITEEISFADILESVVQISFK